MDFVDEEKKQEGDDWDIRLTDKERIRLGVIGKPKQVLETIQK